MRERLSTGFLPETDEAWAVLSALLAAAVFGNTLAGGFVRSDFQLLADNPLLRGWSGLPALLLGRSWEGPLGTEVAPPAYRPLAMLSYLLSCQLAGPAPWVQHLVNTALYAADCALLFLVGRRFCSRRTAFAAACLFAVLPVHCEVVAYASERAELLLLFFLLLAWRELGRRRPRPWPGFLYYGLALASREQALLFPLLLALQDWVFLRRRFWHAPRRWVHLSAAGMSLAWLILGRWASGGAAASGRDYFEGLSYPVRLLTMARFSLSHYVFPLVSGTGLQGDYARPFFPDSQPADLASWGVLIAAAVLLGWAARGVLRQRSRYAFWTLFAFLLWLPESNLLGATAVLGSDRALFLPSIGYCFGLAMALSRVGMPWRAVAVLSLSGWYGGLSVARNRAWSDERRFQEEAARLNPHGKGLASLGISLLERGRQKEGVEILEEAARLGPGLPEPL
ncbi:MAG: hypothetical protein AAB576_11330, partial [Elusimicrobiota bacterium]